MDDTKHKADLALPYQPELTQMTINEQIKSCADKLEAIVTNTDHAIKALDACVQQYREFDAGDREFSDWLDNAEKQVDEALVPRSTVQEKQDQLETIKVRVTFLT